MFHTGAFEVKDGKFGRVMPDDVPEDAVWVRRGNTENSFGAYYYASWILPESRATD